MLRQFLLGLVDESVLLALTASATADHYMCFLLSGCGATRV